jgi:hypothetical protein
VRPRGATALVRLALDPPDGTRPFRGSHSSRKRRPASHHDWNLSAPRWRSRQALRESPGPGRGRLGRCRRFSTRARCRGGPRSRRSSGRADEPAGARARHGQRPLGPCTGAGPRSGRSSPPRDLRLQGRRVANRTIRLRDRRAAEEHGDGRRSVVVDPTGWLRVPSARRGERWSSPWPRPAQVKAPRARRGRRQVVAPERLLPQADTKSGCAACAASARPDGRSQSS